MDNILVVYEHTFKKQSGANQFYIAFMLDIAKAYGRFEWSIPHEIMGKLGFHNHFCNWIMESVTTVMFSIMINDI